MINWLTGWLSCVQQHTFKSLKSNNKS